MSAPDSRFQIAELQFANPCLKSPGRIITYAALRELLSLSYAEDGVIEFRLRAGEMLVFNNQRLMHGRTAFNPGSSKRHIRSCHVDLDEFYSRLRVIYAERQDPRRWMTFRKD